jgi:hypothetical protein
MEGQGMAMDFGWKWRVGVAVGPGNDGKAESMVSSPACSHAPVNEFSELELLNSWLPLRHYSTGRIDAFA